MIRLEKFAPRIFSKDCNQLASSSFSCILLKGLETVRNVSAALGCDISSKTSPISPRAAIAISVELSPSEEQSVLSEEDTLGIWCRMPTGEKSSLAFVLLWEVLRERSSCSETFTVASISLDFLRPTFVVGETVDLLGETGTASALGDSVVRRCSANSALLVDALV